MTTKTRNCTLTLHFSAEEYDAILAHLTEFDEPGEKAPSPADIERWAKHVVMDWVCSARDEP